MSTLQERLKRIKEGFLKQAPQEAVDAIQRSNEALHTSGLLDGLPAVGSPLPPFDLEDSDGGRVRSDSLLERGPLVVTFYRGGW